MTTQHNEIHVAHTAAEAEDLSRAGLPHVLDTQACAACAAPVGPSEGKFVPVAIILSEDEQWYGCMRCVAPTLWPRN